MSFQTTFEQQRQTLRHQIRQRRRALTTVQQYDCALQMAEQVMQHPRIQAAHTVAVFLSFDGELETGPLISLLWQQHKQVYLPVLHPFSAGHLLFLRYTADTPLLRNRLAILEPTLDVNNLLPLSQLEIILTPLVAFDHTGQRLGMGGGFYDRTLQHWQHSGPYPIGLAHDCQQVPLLPQEKWDIPLPEIITPTKNWQWPTAK